MIGAFEKELDDLLENPNDGIEQIRPLRERRP